MEAVRKGIRMTISLPKLSESANAGRCGLAVINQIRRLLPEHGITMRKARKHLESSLRRILEDARTNYPES
jgi:hypothetical protein